MPPRAPKTSPDSSSSFITGTRLAVTGILALGGAGLVAWALSDSSDTSIKTPADHTPKADTATVTGYRESLLDRIRLRGDATLPESFSLERPSAGEDSGFGGPDGEDDARQVISLIRKKIETLDPAVDSYNLPTLQRVESFASTHAESDILSNQEWRELIDLIESNNFDGLQVVFDKIWARKKPWEYFQRLLRAGTIPDEKIEEIKRLIKTDDLDAAKSLMEAYETNLYDTERLNYLSEKITDINDIQLRQIFLQRLYNISQMPNASPEDNDKRHVEWIKLFDDVNDVVESH